MENVDLDEKKKRIEAWGKVILLLIAGLVVAPFIYVAIGGLIGLAIAFVLAVAIVQFAPLISMKIANWRLQAIKNEAARNPIETLQNNLAFKQENLKKNLEAITTFDTEYRTFVGQLEGFKKQYPDEVERFAAMKDKMGELLSVRQEKYMEAKKAVAVYAEEIKKATAIWNMGQAAAKMNKVAGAMTDEDFLEKIKVETSLDSVEKSMNRAFSELDEALLQEKDEKEVHQLAAPVINQIESARSDDGISKMDVPQAKQHVKGGR